MVKIIDAEAENFSPEQVGKIVAAANPALAGISAYTTKMTAAGETLRVLKKKAPHIKTILGGSHPSSLPERTLSEEQVDSVCQGPGRGMG